MPTKHLAFVRFIHNVSGTTQQLANTNVNVLLNNQPYVLNLAYLDSTAYLEVNPDKYKVVVKLSQQNIVLLETKLSVSVGNYYTIIVAGSVNQSNEITGLVYQDDLTCPNPGYAKIRVINSAVDSGSLDVFSNNKLIFAGVKFGQTGTPTYLKIKIGESLSDIITFRNSRTGEYFGNPINLFPISGGIYTIITSEPPNDIVLHDNKDNCEILKEKFSAQDYMGKWFQIASIPQFFDQDCARSTAEYTLLSDKINVFNTCYDEQWNVIRTITGSAVASNPCIPAALTVTFPGFNDTASIPIPIGPNYLIHATDYVNYAIVGSPSRTSLFILSRDHKINAKNYHRVLDSVKFLGYDIQKIRVNYKAVVEK